jgi:hypothetical protein
MERQDTDEMTDAECWQMLGTQQVGRLALSVAALPAILPVQYYVDGDQVAICLGHHDLDRRTVDEAVVAFSSDFLDFTTRSGWSVQVQGRAALPREPGVPTDCGSPTAGQIIHLAPITLRGYRISLCPFVAARDEIPPRGRSAEVDR